MFCRRVTGISYNRDKINHVNPSNSQYFRIASVVVTNFKLWVFNGEFIVAALSKWSRFHEAAWQASFTLNHLIISIPYSYFPLIRCYVCNMINGMKFKVLLRLKTDGIYVSIIGLGNSTSTISLGLVIWLKIKREAFS